MKRLFFQTKLYDYSSIKEAEKHIKEMESKNWHPKRQNDGKYIFNNAQDSFPFSVEYFKEL